MKISIMLYYLKMYGVTAQVSSRALQTLALPATPALAWRVHVESGKTGLGSYVWLAGMA